MDDGGPEPAQLSMADFATMAITFFSLGVTLQVLLIDTGTSVLRAAVASSVIFSATSQFAYLAVRDAGGGEVAAIIAGAIMATRFGILAVSLSRRLGDLPTWRRAVAYVNAFDPNVAIGVQQPTPALVEREFWRTTAGMMIGWFSGVAAGSLLGDVLGDTERFGLDALFPAALLAIIGNLLRTKDGFAAGVTGGLVCLALIPIAPAGLPIILSLVGVGAALLMNRDQEEPS